MVREDVIERMNDGEKDLYYTCKQVESEVVKLLPNVLLKRNDEGTN